MDTQIDKSSTIAWYENISKPFVIYQDYFMSDFEWNILWAIHSNKYLVESA